MKNEKLILVKWMKKIMKMIWTENNLRFTKVRKFQKIII